MQDIVPIHESVDEDSGSDRVFNNKQDDEEAKMSSRQLERQKTGSKISKAGKPIDIEIEDDENALEKEF